MAISVRAAAVVGAVVVAVAAGGVLGQDGVFTSNRDIAKLLDGSPPYRGPGIVGTPMRPGALAGRGFAAEGVTLESWISLEDFPTSPTSASSCWGYVSPSGREYAIIGLSTGTGIVDITDPVNPVTLGVIDGPDSFWREMKVLGEYAYSVNESGAGIQVIDLRQADQGIVTLTRNKSQNGHATTHTLASNPDSGYIYLCGSNISNGGLVAVNCANPSDPVIAGAWTGNYIHEAQVVTYTSGPYAGKELAFCFNGSKVRIIDVTNKSNMHQISQVTYAGVRYCHQGWLSGDRRYLYVDDEFDEAKGRDRTTTHIVNVEDPADPVYLGIWQGPLPASDHNQYWHEGKLFQANYRAGLQVLDATDPVNLVRVAYLDTHPETDNAGFAGSWSCFPFFPSGSVIISDMQRGLFVARLGEPCGADFNGDGEVNTLDVAAFLNAWAAGDTSADMNGDGVVNTLDVSAFLNAWTAGC